MELKNNYTPFLKFKSNEVSGLSALTVGLKQTLTPFFDIPRKDGMTLPDFEEVVGTCSRKALKWLGEFPYFFVDSYDISDDIAVVGSPNCRVVIDAFTDFTYVPVVGLDRAPDHNQAIFDAKKATEIRSDTVAVRLQADDFASFALTEDELSDLVTAGSAHFKNWIFILDCRVCDNSNVSKLASDVAAFVASAAAKFEVQKFIVTGSSIPASIAGIAKKREESTVARAELEVFHTASKMLGEEAISLGDYTIVSPLYSDLSLPPEMLHSVMAAKVIYAYQNFHYIVRGASIKTQGYQQYNDIASEIILKSFYRGPHYSWGDLFIHEKAAGLPPNVTPSAILKPTICAHITYMALDYPA